MTAQVDEALIFDGEKTSHRKDGFAYPPCRGVEGMAVEKGSGRLSWWMRHGFACSNNWVR